MAKAQREAWKTFTVAVREVRGDARIRATVTLSDVTGKPGTQFVSRTVWSGVVATREPGESMTVEEAAELGAHALRLAYPGLF